MDRDARVREGRRRQVEDALTFERDREALLRSELDDILTAAGGPALDERIFALMQPGEAALVRAALGEGQELQPVDDPDPHLDDSGLWADWEESAESAAELTADDEAELELEVARLREEIDTSRSVQAALARYLELIAGDESG